MGGPINLFDQFKTWVLVRSPRELGMLAASTIVVGYFVVDRAILVSQSARLTQAEQQLHIAQGMRAAAQSALSAIESGQQGVPGAGDKASTELDELRRQARSIDVVLGEGGGGKSAIGPLIRNLIATRHPRVTLLSLKTIPPSPLSAGAAAQSAAPGAAGIYRHGVQVELSGAYLDLLAYLRSLEAGSQGLFWSDARLSANTYPEVTLRLTIYILSNRSDPFIS